MDADLSFHTGTGGLMIRILATAGILIAIFNTSTGAAPAEAPPPPPPSTTTTAPIGSVKPSQTVVQTTTTTTAPPAPVGECAEWYGTAIAAGWPEDLWERLDYVLWRESRCLPDAHNPNDPHSGSYGLAQINGFWCRPSRYHPDGWLQTQNVLNACTDLYDPLTNLVAAKAIYDYAEARGCGWSPWSTRNTRWC